MDTPRGVRRWAVSAAITAPSTARTPACAVVGAGVADTVDPADAVAWVEQVAATSAQPSCSC